ncbi:MAG: hypothetical protein DCC57_19610 [Chloroflexi bacterium]|nr:MAG: hypothetical protein DCC57_19610 [Chloroflexota bacterium]
MQFLDHAVRGIAHCWLDADLKGEPLHVHITEVAPGHRSPPPHQHGGLEGVYMIEGEGTLEIDGVAQVLRANEATVFDPRKLHGLVNHSRAPMRYLVILTQDAPGS